LGHLQILLFGYPSELASVFLEVIVQQMFGTEARTSREHEASQCEYTRNQEEGSIASQ
jgi:hypothetical protein